MIMNNMFSGCSSFTEITISSPLTTIGSDAFVSCISLRNVWFQTPSSLTTIQHYAFYGCPLKQVYIPISVQNIGTNAFPRGSKIIKKK